MIAAPAYDAQRRAADAAASAWVAASAGTGKTKVLTDRVLALLLKGSAPQRILCLTFTKAAAAEMAIRLSQRLGDWAIADDATLRRELTELLGGAPKAETVDEARRLFARLLDTPGGMRIDTIHAFCQSILRRFPIEAGIAPHFTVLDERTAAEVLQQARSQVLEMPELAPALGEIAAQTGEGGFDALIAEIAGRRAKLEPLLAEGLEAPLARLRDLLGVAAGETPAVIVAEACRDFDDGMVMGAARALVESERSSGEDRKRGAGIVRWLERPATRAAHFDDYVACYFTKAGERRKSIYTKNFLNAESQEAVTLDGEFTRIATAVARRGAAALYAATAALLAVAEALLRTYRALKERRALLDYDDLILTARALLSRPGVAPWVLFKLDGGLDHILIDEAQDTNPEQWRVVADLAEEFFAGEGARDRDRTVFAVGDAKQSIFSFQGADPAEFARMRDHFAARVPGDKWRPVGLDRSFRSVPAVLQAVDAVFAQPAAADGVVPVGTRLRHIADRDGMAGLVELWPPVPAVEESAESAWDVATGRRRSRPPPARLARAVARRIARWIGDKEWLPARGRAVTAGDILVLVRRRNAFVVELIRALKDARVAVAGADRMRLAEQLAVEDLVALGNFLLLPEDELTLATVLKSPLFDWDDDLLYQLAWPREHRSLWAELGRRAGERPEFARAADELSALLARADFVPPYELYAEVLGARGGRRAMLRRLGPDAADPLDEFLAAALSYERVHAPSLQGFLAWLAAGQAEVKRDLDRRGRDEVRIMTVHGAKGLQAPIVILPDTLQMPKQLPRLLWSAEGMPLWCGQDGAAAAFDLAKQRAELLRDQEYRRLLYVALTRAEDRLYVCGWNTRRPAPSGNWHELIKGGLENCAGVASFDFAVDGAEGWSGPGLRLESAQTVPVAALEGLATESAMDHPEPGWLRQVPRPEPSPPRPLAPSRPARPDPPARSPLAQSGQDRFLRGRLVHRLLQSLPELPPDRRAEAGRRYLARAVHGLAPEQQEELLAETLAVLARSDFAAIFGPDSRAEVPVVALLGDRAVAGQIDRIVVLPDRVLIVDYKTLRPPPPQPEGVPAGYLHQLAAYRAAVAAIYPGRPVEAAILWTDGPLLMPIPASLLNLSSLAGASLPPRGGGPVA